MVRVVQSVCRVCLCSYDNLNEMTFDIDIRSTERDGSCFDEVKFGMGQGHGQSSNKITVGKCFQSGRHNVELECSRPILCTHALSYSYRTNTTCSTTTYTLQEFRIWADS